MNRQIWTIAGIACAVCLLQPSISHADDASPKTPAAKTFDIGFLGLHGGIYEHLEKHAGPLKLRLRYFEDGEVAAKKADFGSVRVLYVQHTRAEDHDRYRELIERAKQRNPSLQIIVFQPSSEELFRSLGLGKLVTKDADAKKYYGSSSENLRRLLVYTAAKYLGRDLRIESPQDVERQGLYHPDHEELFPDVKSFLAWQATRGKVQKDQPRLLVAVHSTHLFFQQPKVVDALVREAEKQGALAVAIVDGRSDSYTKQAIAFHPHAVHPYVPQRRYASISPRTRRAPLAFDLLSQTVDLGVARKRYRTGLKRNRLSYRRARVDWSHRAADRRRHERRSRQRGIAPAGARSH